LFDHGTNPNKDHFWGYYFNTTTAMVFNFFAVIGHPTPSQTTTDWLSDGPAQDLNQLMRQAIEPVYDLLYHHLRYYELEKAADMVEQQLEADAFAHQDDFPDKTLIEIATELAETTNYNWVHRRFERVSVDDNLYPFLAQFFKSEPQASATPITQPTLFATCFQSRRHAGQNGQLTWSHDYSSGQIAPQLPRIINRQSSSLSRQGLSEKGNGKNKNG
jgi:hypothetical protein